jgi:hypothetical protein
VRLRLLLIVCGLVILAFAGLRQTDEHSIEMSGTGAPIQLSAEPTPEPSLPAIAPDVASASPTTPTALTSARHRHLRPADTAVTDDRPISRATFSTPRPLTFPLLI